MRARILFPLLSIAGAACRLTGDEGTAAENQIAGAGPAAATDGGARPSPQLGPLSSAGRRGRFSASGVDAGAFGDAGARPDDAGTSRPSPVWRLELGSTMVFDSPFRDADGTLQVVGAPEDVRIRVTRSNPWSRPGIAVRSLGCRPIEAALSLRWTSGSGVSTELPIRLEIVAGDGPGALVPMTCMRLDTSYGALVADVDAEHGWLLSKDCRLHRVDLATMQFDGAPVQVGTGGDECQRLIRAVDGRLYAETRATGATDWLRFRLDPTGQVDVAFALRSATAAVVDARGGDVFVDGAGVLRRRDASGAVDPSFTAPTFGSVVRLFPFSRGIVVAEEDMTRPFDTEVFATTLAHDGSVVVARRSVWRGENASISWIHELANGDLFVWTWALAPDTGAVGSLVRWVGPKSDTLFWAEWAAPPVTAPDGAHYLFGGVWNEGDLQELFRVAPNGALTELGMFASGWRNETPCGFAAGSATMRSDGTIALVARDPYCDPDHELLAAVRVR